MSYEGQNTTICWKKQLVSGPALYFGIKKRKETLEIEGTKYWCLQRGETGGLNKVKDAGWIMVAPELYAKNSWFNQLKLIDAI